MNNRLDIIIEGGLKQCYINTKLLTDQNTRDHSAWTIGNGEPMHELCTPHRTPRE